MSDFSGDYPTYTVKLKNGATIYGVRSHELGYYNYQIESYTRDYDPSEKIDELVILSNISRQQMMVLIVLK